MHFNRCICPIITTRWKLFCATSLIGNSKGDDAGLILVQSPDASSFILLSNPTAFLGGGRCLINSHKLAENEIVTEACVWPSSQVNTLVIRHKTPHPRMHVYNCNVDQVSMGPESKLMWQWRALWLKEPEGRVTISFPLKRAGASEHSDKVQAAANESKPTGEITPTEARNLRLQKDYSNCTQEQKKKKKSLRIKKPFRVGQGTFRTPLGRVASLSHSGVQTTDALRNAQESSHPRFPHSGHLHRLTCLPGTLPTKLFRWGFTQGSGWQSQVNAAESLFWGSIPGFHCDSLTCSSTSCGWQSGPSSGPGTASAPASLATCAPLLPATAERQQNPSLGPVGCVGLR